jgi:hyperosmotically inducible periplasmic protein
VLEPDTGAVDSSPGESGSSASAASDRSLLDAVVAALSADAALEGTSLNVTVSDGLVTITGTAATSEQAARVHDVATRVAGAGRVSAAVTPSG